MIRVTVTGRHIDGYEFVPGVIRGGVATPLTGDAAQGALDSGTACAPAPA